MALAILELAAEPCAPAVIDVAVASRSSLLHYAVADRQALSTPPSLSSFTAELRLVMEFFRRGRAVNERHVERVRNLSFD